MTSGQAGPPPADPAPRRRFGTLLVDPAPLRHDRDFRLLWAGQGISTAGRMITSVVLPYQVYVITHDLLAVGALSIVQLVPILVFALGGGAVADAVDRRKLLLVTQVGLTFTSVALVVIALLPAAIAMDQLMFNGSAVIGPAIGGIVLATAGIAAAYLIDAVTYLAAITAVLLIAPIRPAPGAVRPSLRAIGVGLRFARRRPEVLATFIVDINAMVFGSPRSLFPALALDVFRVGPAGVGLMSSAVALGAFLATVFAGWMTSVRRPGRVVLIAVAVWSLGIAGFGLATFSFPLALLMLAVAAGADVISAIMRGSIVQLRTPDALRGRVSSIHILVVTGGPRIGDAEASAVAAVIGPAWSVVSGGLLSLAGTAVVALALPAFARLDFRDPVVDVQADAPEGESGSSDAG